MGPTGLSRRPLATIVSDAATVAIGPPGAFGDEWGEADFDEAKVLLANTGADGAYGAYEVLGPDRDVVGLEVVVRSDIADAALEAFVTDQIGPWRPDVDFYSRRHEGAASEAELGTYDRYMALVTEHYGRLLDLAVANSQPEEEAVAVAAGPALVSPNGRFVLCDPYCSGSYEYASVPAGSYRPLKWRARASNDGVLGDVVVRIGVYKVGLCPEPG